MAGNIESRRPGTPPATGQNGATADERTALLGRQHSNGSAHGAGAANGRRSSVESADSDGPKRSIGTPRAVALLLSMWALIFLQASNMSGVTMAQSAIAEDLDSYEDAMWFTTAYLISTSALAPLAGRLATIFSPRSLVLPIGVFFTLGLVLTSVAGSFAVFILGRVLAGIGGAGIMTLAVILILELTSKTRRGLFIGLVNSGFTFGISMGAIVYGALIPVIGWRTIFGVQAPVAIAASLGVFFSIPHDLGPRGPETPQSESLSVREKLARIDYAGAFMLVLTIVLFLYGLSGDVKWTPIILSAAGLFVFTMLEVLVAADPIIPLPILSSRRVLLSCITQLILMGARWTVLFYSPIFVLAVRDYAPAVAGSILVPTNLGFGLGGLVVGWLHIRRNGAFWLPSIISLAIFGVSLQALSLVGTATSPAWAFVLVVFVNGLATGASLNYTLAHLLHLSRPEEHFVSTSLLGTFRGFGGSFGTAIGGGVFYRLLRQGLLDGFSDLDGGEVSDGRRRLTSKLIGSPALVFNGGLSLAERQVAVQGYTAASRGTWQAAAISAILVVVLQAATGWTSPPDRIKDEDDDVRANLTREEGVGEP